MKTEPIGPRMEAGVVRDLNDGDMIIIRETMPDGMPMTKNVRRVSERLVAHYNDTTPWVWIFLPAGTDLAGIESAEPDDEAK